MAYFILNYSMLVLSTIIMLTQGCDYAASPVFHQKNSCIRCHKVTPDKNHDLGCPTCHKGNPSAHTISTDHQGLIPSPAHPIQMGKSCGLCHEKEVIYAKNSIHFTLLNEVNTVWMAFFPDASPIKEIQELPVEDPIRTEKGLVSDMLRKRCLRCHVYYKGDSYDGTRRGTGCASCHISKKNRGHAFQKNIDDERCLSCHYGNFVGWDYYGRFEKDYEEDFRAPLDKGAHLKRPYGLEWHEMTSDIHRTSGLSCTDCHLKGPCYGGFETISCLECHSPDAALPKKAVPLDADRIGHRKEDVSRVDCAACHAVWSFEDRGRTLSREDAPFIDEWKYLATQGNSEIELFFSSRGCSVKAKMLDKINNEMMNGLWFQVFFERRWEQIALKIDNKGRLMATRPLLDISLNYTDSKGHIVFEDLKPKIKNFSLSYHPHTIGKADVFRTISISRWLLNPKDGSFK